MILRKNEGGIELPPPLPAQEKTAALLLILRLYPYTENFIIFAWNNIPFFKYQEKCSP